MEECGLSLLSDGIAWTGIIRKWKSDSNIENIVRRLISEQLMSSCVHHTHLLFSEVDVGQSEVDCVKVGGTGDIVHCSLVTVLSRGEVPHQKVGVA